MAKSSPPRRRPYSHTHKTRSQATNRKKQRNPRLEQLEERILLSTVEIDGTGGADSFLLRRNPSNVDNIQIQRDGTTLFDGAASDVDAITINGLGGDDTLTIDFTYGNPIPSGGLDYDGGTGADELKITHATADQVTYRFDGPDSGSISLLVNGTTLTINYTDLEPIYDATAAAHRVFNFTGGAEMISLGDDSDSGDGESFIDSNLAESVTFANPTDSLTINAAAGLGPDTINLNALDSTFNADVIVNASSGGDTVNLNATTGITNSYSLNGGTGADTFNVAAAAVTRPVGIGGGPGSDTLSITGTGADETWAVNLQNGSVIGLSGGATLSYGQLEKLALDLAGGDDVLAVVGTTNDDAFQYSPAATADTSTLSGFNTLAQSVTEIAFTGVDTGGLVLDANAGMDTLQVNTPGTEPVVATAEAIAVGSRVPVRFGGIASGSLVGGLTALTIAHDDSGGTTVLETGAMSDSGAFTAPGGPRFTFADLTPGAPITIYGGSGDDILLVQHDGAALLDATITFDGGSQLNGDTLRITGSSPVTNETHQATGADTGTISLDGITTINYTGLEPVYDSLPATNFLFETPPNAADRVVYEDGETNANAHQIRSTTGGFETYEFRNKANVVLDTGTGARDWGDSVILSTTQTAAGLQSLTILTGGGGDGVLVELPFNGGVPIASLSVDGEAGLNILDVQGPDGAANSYVVTSTSVAVSGQQTINYARFQRLDIDTGDMDDSGLVDLDGMSSPLLINIDGGPGTVDLTVRGTSGDDLITVVPTNPEADNDTTVSVARVGLVQARSLAGDTLRVEDGGGTDVLRVVARGSIGYGGAPTVADGSDTISVSGDGQSTDQIISITNATQGALATVVVADDDFSGGLTIVAGNEASSDEIDVEPNVDRPITILGGTPTLPTLPGDRLNVDITGTTGAGLAITGPGSGRMLFSSGHLPITFESIESFSATGGNYGTILDVAAVSPPDGLEDEITLQLNDEGTSFEVSVNGSLVWTADDDTVYAFTVLGSSDPQKVTVIESLAGFPGEAGGFSGNAAGSHTNSAFVTSGRGPDNVAIHYAGNGGEDSLEIRFLTERNVAYFADNVAAANSGLVNIDGGLTVSFAGLAPLNLVGAGGSLTVDATASPATSSLTIQDAGTPTDGVSRVLGNGGFETTTFSGFGTITVLGGIGPETITLESIDPFDPDGAGPAEAVVQVTLDGDNTTNTDLAPDTLNVRTLPASVTAKLSGGGGPDTFLLDSLGTAFLADGTVDGILGPVLVSPAGDEGGFDRLFIDDTAASAGDTVLLTDNSIEGITGYAGMPDVVYGMGDQIELVSLFTSNFADTVNVVSTRAGSVYNVNTQGGDDTINISSDAPLNTGTLNSIDGQVNLNSGPGVDRLILSDAGDAVGDTYVLGLSGTATELSFGDGSAPVDVRFNTSGPNQLEHFRLITGQGADQITNDDADGGSPLQANMLATQSNVFDGQAGSDTFEFEWSAAFSLPATTQLVINGGAPAFDPSNRDVVHLRADFADDGFRNMFFRYADASKASGDVDVRGLHAGPGYVDINGVEQVNYVGDSDNDDALHIFGTAADDTLSVTPVGPNEVNVFLDGDPLLTLPPGSPGTNNPGVAGGAAGPDLNLRGGAQGGFLIHGGGSGVLGDRLVVNAPTEDVDGAGSSAAWAGNAFGSSSVVRAPGNAFDNIEISDSRVRITTHTAAGVPTTLMDVNIDTGSFGRTNPADAELTVNTGEEAGLRSAAFGAANGGGLVADDITVALSTAFRFQVNAGAPPLPIAPPLSGDRLQVAPLPNGNFNIFSDAAPDNDTQVGPNHPNVSITSSAGGMTSQPLTYNSVELLTLRPSDATQELNVLGDDGGFNPGQQDEVMVFGQDVDSMLPGGDADGTGELALLLNGSNPIFVYNVRYLNVLSAGGDDDVTVDPWADDSTGGWGIDVRVDSGAGDDDIVYGNVEYDPTLQPGIAFVDASPDGSRSSVSEDVVVAPSTTPGTGQIRSTNASDGTNILTLDFVNTEDLSVFLSDGTAGDTDSLTVLGTDAGDTLTVNLANSGDDSAPLIDIASGTPPTQLVQIENFAVASPLPNSPALLSPLGTLRLNSGSGDDVIRITGRTDGATEVLADGGPPAGSDTLVLPGTTDGNDLYELLPGTATDQGTANVQLAGAVLPTIIDYTRIETVVIDGGSGSGSDSLTIRGTDDADTVDVIGIAPTAGTVDTSFGPLVTFVAFGSDASSLNLVTAGGDDSVSAVRPSAWGIATVSIQAGGPSTSDTVQITASSSDDEATYLPTGSNSGILTLGSGLSTTTYLLNNVEGLSLDGGAETVADFLTVNAFNATVTPSTEPGAGSVAPVDPFGNRLLALDYRDVEQVQVIGNTVLIQGTDDNDSIRLTGDGVATVTDAFGNENSLDVSNFSVVILNGRGGDDDIVVEGDAAQLFEEVIVVGGDNGTGSDSLTVLGTAVDDTLSLDLAASTATVNGLPIVFDGIEQLSADMLAGDDTVAVLELGTPAGLARVAVVFEPSAGDAFRVGGTVGPDTIEYTPTDASSGIVRHEASPLLVGYSGLHADADFSINGGTGGFDVLRVVGTEGPDVVTNSTASDIHLLHTVRFDGSVDRLDIVTRGGDDTVVLEHGIAIRKVLDLGAGDDVVDLSSAAATDPLIYGGPGDDTIFGSPGTDIIFAGAGDDVVFGLGGDDTIYGEEGNDELHGIVGDDRIYGGKGQDRIIQHSNNGQDTIEGGPGTDTLLVLLSGNDDTLTVAAGSNGTVTLQDAVTSTISATSIEAIDARLFAGNDSVVLGDLTGTDVRTLSIATASGDDTVEISGTSGPDSIAVTQVGPSVEVRGLHAAISVSGLETDETLRILGDAGSDNLVLTGVSPTVVVQVASGAAGGVLDADLRFEGIEALTLDATNIASLGIVQASTFVFTPGTTADTGSVVADRLEVGYVGLQPLDSLILSGNSPFDSVIAYGTPDDDTVLASGTGIQLLGRAPITIANMEAVSIRTGAGDDEVIITPSADVAFDVQAGAPSASDVLAFNATGTGAVTVDLGNANVSQTGMAAVTYSGVELLNIDAGNQPLTVLGTNGDDTLIVQPLTADSGSVRVDGMPPSVAYSNIQADAITVNGGAGQDRVAVYGTSLSDTFDVSGSSVQVGGQTVDVFAESLAVYGLEGEDTFNVTPSATVPIFVDGGDPIGETPGDVLNIFAMGPAIVEAGPQSDEGAVIDGGKQRVSFDRIEGINVLGGGGGGGPAVVMGTNGDDSITVIARDDSTHAGADGVQDFTVSVNAGAEIYFQDFPSLQVHALSGSDEIVLRTPAPNDAEWDVDVTIYGGPPSASDRLVIETPGQDNALYTPGSLPDSGSVLIDEAGNDSLFMFEGIEELVYDGEGGDDLLVVQAIGRVVHEPGAQIDSGIVAPGSSLPIQYVQLGSFGRVDVAGQGPSDTLIVKGTADDDELQVAFSGADEAAFSLATSAGLHVPLTTTGVENYELRLLDGDDEVGLQSPLQFSGTFAVMGSDNGTGTDVLQLAGDPLAAQTVVIAPNAPRTDEQVILGFGPRPVDVSGVELISYASQGANDTLVVALGDTGTQARVFGSGPDVVLSDSLPRIEFRGIETFRLVASSVVSQRVTFVPGGLSEASDYEFDGGPLSTLVVEGSDGLDDAFSVADPDGPGGIDVQVIDVNHLIAITEPNGALGRLELRTLGGDDTVVVDLAGGDVIGVPITIDGGLNRDALVLTGSPQTAVDEVVYSLGSLPDSGSILFEDATDTALMMIDFVGLEPIFDNVPAATLTINGNNSANAINLTQGPGGGIFVGATNLVSVDAFETYEFNNKLNLVINGRSGSDEINLNNGGIAASGLANITVYGGDPTGSDRVIVNGTGGADAIGYAPSSASAGELTGVQGVNVVTVVGTEELLLNGQGGGDQLVVTTPVGGDAITYAPGPDADAGTVGVGQSLPLTFVQFGNGSVRLDDAGQTRADLLLYTATSTNDQLRVGATTGQIDLLSGFVGPYIPLLPDSVAELVVNMLAGDDTVLLEAPLPFANTAVLGGEPDASDQLFLRGTAGDDVVSVDLDVSAVDGFGGTVHYLGVDEIALLGAGGTDDLAVSGTADEDLLSYRPTGATAGSFWLDGQNTIFTFTDFAGAFAVDLGGSVSDRLVLIGTNNHDVITIDSPNRTAWVENAVGTILKPVRLEAGVEAITAEAGLGNDTFLVIPAPAIAVSPDGQPYNLSITVDGGPPSASDALVVAQAGGAPLPATDFAVVYQSRRPDEGRVRVYRNAVAMPDIGYSDVEIVSPITDPGVGPENNLLIAGPDLYEQNQYRATAAFLGSGEVINVRNLVIFPNWGEHRFVPSDEDWFRVVAEQTGTLDFQVYFRMFDPNLLPAGGDIEIEVYDADGDLIAGHGPNFGTNDSDADERIRIPAVAGQTYYLRVYGAPTGAPLSQVVNAYDMTIINTPAPVPYDLELDDTPVDPNYDCDNDPPSVLNSDTGRSQFDNVTCDNSPTIFVRLDDDVLREDLPGNPGPDSPPDEVIPIPFNPSIDPANADPGYRVAIFVEGDPQQPGQDPQVLVGYAQPGGEDGVYVFDFDDAFNGAGMDLTDGSHFISAKVEIIDPANPAERGYGSRSATLEIVVDTVKPPVAFGEPAVPFDGLHPDSDTGIEDQPDTFIDRITADTTPTFWGIAEANSIVRVYADTNGNGVFDEGTDLFLGETVAVPLDGTNQFPRGLWEFTTEIDMNDPRYFPEDGLRRIFVTAEDLAGNVSEPDQLDIFIDTRGPRVWSIEYVPLNGGPNVPVFTPKPLSPLFGPTPLTQAIDITFRDEPARVNGALGFVYPAVNEVLATTPGNYRLVGDANGHILIESVEFLDSTVAGDVAWTTVRLHFATPLPDDRFTLTIFDRIADEAGNKLDGDVQATGPGTSVDVLPSGDGVPGESFVGRFTVDSRPEIGVFNDRLWFIDLNGNGIFDPTNRDATNRDIVWRFGQPGDWPVVGDWDGDGFDEIGVYGFRGTTYRFELDVNGNGTLDAGDAVFVFSGANAQPVAGDWNGDGVDEVGLFLNRTWWLDLDGDFVLDPGETIATNMVGHPVAADWDGDGDDDVGVYVTNTKNGVPTNRWILDLDDNFRRNAGDLIINESPPLGGRKRPVAADWNARGTGKIGIFKINPREREAEWMLDVDRDGRFEPPPTGTPGIPLVDQDIFYRFGDRRSEPVVGNFDPPPQGSKQSTIPVVTEDPGNGPRRAYRLPLADEPILLAADISNPRDRDWYVFRAPVSGRIAVDVTTPMSPLDPMVLVRQGRKTIARNGNFKGTVDSHVEFQVRKGRTYRILVRPQRGTTGSYVLQVEYLKPARDDHGGRFANATVLERIDFGDHTMFLGTGTTERARDRDMFILDIDRAGEYRISIDNLTVGFHSVVTLFDAGRNRLVRFDTAEPSDPTKPNEVTLRLETGRYYVLVEGHAGLRGEYELIVDEAVADILDDMI